MAAVAAWFKTSAELRLENVALATATRGPQAISAETAPADEDGPAFLRLDGELAYSDGTKSIVSNENPLLSFSGKLTPT